MKRTITVQMDFLNDGKGAGSIDVAVKANPPWRKEEECCSLLVSTAIVSMLEGLKEPHGEGWMALVDHIERVRK